MQYWEKDQKQVKTERQYPCSKLFSEYRLESLSRKQSSANVWEITYEKCFWKEQGDIMAARTASKHFMTFMYDT